MPLLCWCFSTLLKNALVNECLKLGFYAGGVSYESLSPKTDWYAVQYVLPFTAFHQAKAKAAAKPKLMDYSGLSQPGHIRWICKGVIAQSALTEAPVPPNVGRVPFLGWACTFLVAGPEVAFSLCLWNRLFSIRKVRGGHTESALECHHHKLHLLRPDAPGFLATLGWVKKQPEKAGAAAANARPFSVQRPSGGVWRGPASSLNIDITYQAEASKGTDTPEESTSKNPESFPELPFVNRIQSQTPTLAWKCPLFPRCKARRP